MELDINQLAEQIQPALEKLAEKLGVAVEHVWSLAVTQAKIKAIYLISAIGFGYLLAFISWIVFIVSIKRDWDGEGKALWLGISLVLTVISIITTFVHLETILTAWLNPEWYVLQTLFDLIKPTG